jgi:aspartyl-tRNA(Asn)/glutamyl-tRNA(Gln) amidotransferase subunit C
MSILGWIEQLSEVDTENVRPMTSVVETEPVLRSDEVTDGDRRDEVTANAPSPQHGFFTVPKVVE